MSQAIFNTMKISGISLVIPDYPRDIEEDIQEFDNDPAKLARAKKIIGFGTRYNCPPGATPADLALASTKKLLDDMNINLNEIDALICVMQKPDHSQPGSSFMIHRELNMPQSCVCIDLNQGCPGFVYGLWMAGCMIESGACRRIIVTTADYYNSSPVLRNRILFGAAGASALVNCDEEAKPSYFNLGADGKYYDFIINPAGGARLPIREDILNFMITDAKGNNAMITDEFLDGLEVFNFSIREVPPSISDLFKYAKIEAKDIDFAAFHQANKQIVDHIASKAGFSKAQYSVKTFSEYGNQSSASVPGNLVHILGDRLPNEKLKVLLCGFGIGAAWASCLTELDHIYCSGVVRQKFEGMRTREEEIDHWVKKIGGRQ